MLAIDTPRVDPQSELHELLHSLSLFFCVAFTVEMSMKVVSNGLLFTDRAYLRDAWNCLDFVIVGVSWVCLIPSLQDYTALRSIRLLRCSCCMFNSVLFLTH